MPRSALLTVVHPDTPTGPSDDALMALASAGDASAFADLVRRHQAAVRRYCLVALRDEALASELSQETFLRVWATREKYRPEGRFRHLLFTVAANLCRRAGRRRALWQLFGLQPHHEVAAPELLSELETSQQAALIRAAVARLPEKFRGPLVLRFIEGMDYEDIAEIIGRTPSAARSRIHYGLKALADLLPEDFTP